MIVNTLHRDTPEMIPDRALEALGLLVGKGRFDADEVIDPASGEMRGGAVRGRAIFWNVCSIRHDFDGRA